MNEPEDIIFKKILEIEKILNSIDNLNSDVKDQICELLDDVTIISNAKDNALLDFSSIKKYKDTFNSLLKNDSDEKILIDEFSKENIVLLVSEMIKKEKNYLNLLLKQDNQENSLIKFFIWNSERVLEFLKKRLCQYEIFFNSKFKVSNFSDLKVGNTIKFESGQSFVVDAIFEGFVDLTSTKPYNESLGMNWHEKFFSIKLKNFQIIN
jgi:ASC-1-like (ASCH) protein